MNAPFGMGPGRDRLEALERRMAARPEKNEVLVDDGCCLKVRACFDDFEAPGNAPFVHIEYGFVLATSQAGDPYKTEDGHLDSYSRVSLTYEAMDRLVDAYLSRKATKNLERIVTQAQKEEILAEPHDMETA